MYYGAIIDLVIGKGLSKQSVIVPNLVGLRTARVVIDIGSNPGSSRIQTDKLGPGSFPIMPTSSFSNPITGSTIGSVFREYARYTIDIYHASVM